MKNNEPKTPPTDGGALRRILREKQQGNTGIYDPHIFDDLTGWPPKSQWELVHVPNLSSPVYRKV